MQSQAMNRHATQKYADFERALFMAGHSLEELRKLAQKISKPAQGVSYSVPTKDDVLASITAAEEELDTLKKAAKTYKQELLSRGWRV